MRLTHTRHLVKRFFGFVAGRPLTPREQAVVSTDLSREQAGLFFQQSPADQRHAYEVAARVRSSRRDDRSAIAAALLHDVGKRHSGAGAIGRSLATVLDALKLPLRGDWRRYRNHETLGAADLEAIGADQLAVAFARGTVDPSDSIDPAVWQLLQAADNA